MIFRTSIKSVIRSRGKSALFFSLILALTMVLSLGLYLWAAVGQYLALCNASYRTIGLFEYMGVDYPDETVDDEGLREAARLFDHAAIAGHESVRSWDTSARALGYVDGLTRTDAMVPYKQFAVIVVGSVSPNPSAGMTSAIISECLYSYTDMSGKSVYIDEGGYTLESGRSYILHGEFYYARSSYPHFRIAGFRGADGAQIPGVIDISSADGGYAIDPESPYVAMAQTYRVLNSSVSVFATSELDSILPFHQRQLYITEGRGFTPGEYADSAPVCVVTRLLARQCGVWIGDEITLSIAVGPDKPIYETYRAETGFTYEKRFRIVGITNQLTSMNHYLFIPKSEDIDLSVNQIGYTLGQAVLDNDTADHFYREIEPLLGDRVRLTIYDQGYSSVREPFEDILRVVVIMTVASGFAALAVLVMFGFLFVYRQREVSHIMMALGTGKPRVFLHFLYSSGLIALAGAAAGSAAGYSLSGLVASLVRLIAKGYLDVDRRFSITNLTMDMAVPFSPRPALSLFVYAALAVVAAALMFCLLYTAGSFVRRQTRRRRPRGPRRAARSSRLPGGPMKYCLLSIRRGGSRSAVVPAVSLAIVVFLGHLANTSASYDAKLRQVYDGNVVTGYFTDVNGKQVGALTVEAFQLNEIYASGYIGELSVTKSVPSRYLGRSVVDGEPQFVALLEVSGSSFAAETLYNEILRGPAVILTNDLAKSPEFYYSDTIITEFLSGYDASFLADSVEDKPGCMVSTSLMEETGVRLGDTIRVATATGNMYRYNHLDLRVVGSYVKQGSKDNIYCQLGAYIDPSILTGDPVAAREKLFPYTLDSAVFTVASAERLDDLKTYLSERGYSQVNRPGQIRSFVVFGDKNLLAAVSTLMQQIRYIRILYPFLYILVGAIGFIVSYLISVSRRKEFATMRGLGAEPSCAFLSFFYEQCILCLLGCALGLAAWTLYARPSDALYIFLAAGFAVFYIVGCSLSIRVMGRAAVLRILSQED